MGWPGPMTHRQYEVIDRWLEDEWNVPSRSDHYLMQVGCSVIQSQSKKPRDVKLDQFLIKFSRGHKKPVDRKESIERSKQAWMGLVGTKKLPVRVVKPGETPPP